MTSVSNTVNAHDCNHLRAALTSIDATSQWGMRNIETILSTYLLQAETLGMPESFTRGLRTDVYEMTQQIANDINCQAEYLGCNFKSGRTDHPPLSD